MKRAFIGSMLDFIGIVPSQKDVVLSFWVISNIILCLFVIYMQSSLKFVPLQQKFGLLFLFVLSPAAALQFGYDIGRFDQVNLVLYLLILILVVQKRRSLFPVLPVLLTMGILVHEAFLFVNLPVILSVLVLETIQGHFHKAIFGSCIILVVLTISAILIAGGVDGQTHQLINEKVNRLGHGYGTLEIFSQSVFENTLSTLDTYRNRYVWHELLAAFAVFLFYWIPYLRYFARMHLTLPQRICLYSPLAILPMFALGVDFYRWMALSIINLFVVFIYLAGITHATNLCATLNRTEKFIIKGGYVLFIVGPLGINFSFPYVSKIAEVLLQRIF
jgi:hypothetical protein